MSQSLLYTAYVTSAKPHNNNIKKVVLFLIYK